MAVARIESSSIGVRTVATDAEWMDSPEAPDAHARTKLIAVGRELMECARCRVAAIPTVRVTYCSVEGPSSTNRCIGHALSASHWGIHKALAVDATPGAERSDWARPLQVRVT